MAKDETTTADEQHQSHPLDAFAAAFIGQMPAGTERQERDRRRERHENGLADDGKQGTRIDEQAGEHAPEQHRHGLAPEQAIALLDPEPARAGWQDGGLQRLHD